MRCRSQRSGTLPRGAAQARSRSCSHRSTGASISDARGGAQALSARRRSRRKVLVSPTWTAAPRSSSRQAAYSISQAIASGRSRRSSSVQTFLPRENRPSHSGASPTTRRSRRSSTGTECQRRPLSWRMWPCVPSMKSAGTVSLRSKRCSQLAVRRCQSARACSRRRRSPTHTGSLWSARRRGPSAARRRAAERQPKAEPSRAYVETSGASTRPAPCASGSAQSRHQRIDAAWPPRIEQLAAGHVDEHQRSVHAPKTTSAPHRRAATGTRHRAGPRGRSRKSAAADRS